MQFGLKADGHTERTANAWNAHAIMAQSDNVPFLKTVLSKDAPLPSLASPAGAIPAFAPQADALQQVRRIIRGLPNPGKYEEISKESKGETTCRHRLCV